MVLKQLCFIVAFFMLLLNTAQSQSTNKVIFTFEHKAGNTDLILDTTIFSVWNNKKMKITRAQLYLSEMELQLPNGLVQPLTDHYLLISASEKQVNYDMGNWPVTSIGGATLHVGVPKEINHSDPSLWPPRHPLTLQDPSMHWGWAGGYRFLVVEGKVDNDNDDIPETPFEYHSLGDNLYKAVVTTGIVGAQNGILRVTFTLDYARLFNGLNLKKDLIQHGNGDQNIIMMNNAETAGFIYLANTSTTKGLEDDSVVIHVLPNPSDDVATIQYFLENISGQTDVLVYNANGQLVYTNKGLIPATSFNLPTAALPNGVYQLTLWDNGRLLGQKTLLIQH